MPRRRVASPVSSSPSFMLRSCSLLTPLSLLVSMHCASCWAHYIVCRHDISFVRHHLVHRRPASVSIPHPFILPVAYSHMRCSASGDRHHPSPFSFHRASTTIPAVSPIL
ncbi:hypothetical protein F5148DRAFT_1238485 [Russula earlei]|uniref:Uncharacterized protein n=1 Tax=Russula earlei TaxID=71964 RepID=A0ACC0TWK5_9AGAM|nr:hypothetical protein F5148DRAFT_1238485 [Russula earlei]